MGKNERLIYGIIITTIIFYVATMFGKYLNPDIELIPQSFGTHSIMLILSIIIILLLKRNVEYKISLPKFKKILKPILFGILVTIIVNVSLTIITKITGNNIEGMKVLEKMTPIQVFLFVFIYASVAEEILFRGFLLNILKPLNEKGIIVFKRKVSISVIISAIIFGLAHLILITTGAGLMLLIRVVVFTTVLGLVAGYYQEKHNNNAYAIIVHMSGNLLAILGSILMTLNVS